MATKLTKVAREILEVLKDPKHKAYIQGPYGGPYYLNWIDTGQRCHRKVQRGMVDGLSGAKALITTPAKQFDPNAPEHADVYVYCTPQDFDRIQEERVQAVRLREQRKDDQRRFNRDCLLRCIVDCNNPNQAKRVMRAIMQKTQSGTVSWPDDPDEKAQEKEAS